jgi:hypothetical protein
VKDTTRTITAKGIQNLETSRMENIKGLLISNLAT